MISAKNIWARKFILLSWFFLFPIVGHAEQLVSQIVGQVSKHSVTSREVQIDRWLNERLADDKKASTHREDLGRLPGQETLRSEEYKRALNSVLLEWMIFLEAQSFDLATLKEEEFNKAWKQAQRWLNRKVAKSLEVTSSELETNLRRKLQAQKLMKFKSEAASVPVSDSRAREFYDPRKFGRAPFESVKENIKRFVQAQDVDEQMSRWIEVLKRRYKPKILLPVSDGGKN